MIDLKYVYCILYSKEIIKEPKKKNGLIQLNVIVQTSQQCNVIVCSLYEKRKIAFDGYNMYLSTQRQKLQFCFTKARLFKYVDV